MSGAMSESDGITVRPMGRDDVPVVLQLIHELAAFEGHPDGPKLSEADLLEDGFSSCSPWFFGLVAERGGRVVGQALCSRAYSSWTRRAFYLEDLYVVPAARRAGVGLRLLRALAQTEQRSFQMAVAQGVHRIDWHVLADNEPALAFYSRLGARDMLASEGRTAMRLDRAYIEALADHAPDTPVDVRL